MNFRPTILYAILKPIFLLGLVFVLVISAEYYLILKAFLFYPITILLIIYAYQTLYTITLKYELTEEQLIITKGIFSVQTDYLELYRVKDMITKKPFLMRLINAYNLTLYTSDKTDSILKIQGINQNDIQTKFRDYVEINRKLKGVFEVD